jgi:protein TonB
VLKRLQTLSRGTPDEIVLHTLVRNPFVAERELVRLSDLDPDEAQRALAELRSAGALKPLALDNGDTLWLTLELWEAVLSALARMLDGFHQQVPLRRGMPRGEVRSRLQATLPQSQLSVRLFNAIVTEAQSEGHIVADDSFIWHTKFVVKPTLHQQAMVDALLAEFERAPFVPPNPQESLRKLGDDAELLAMLLEQGLLVRVGGDVREPRKVLDVAPVYPPLAAKAHVEGVVIIEATIDTRGRVVNATVLRGVPVLDEAALEAVRQWVYTPTLLDGVPTPIILTVTVRFRLKSAR